MAVVCNCYKIGEPVNAMLLMLMKIIECFFLCLLQVNCLICERFRQSFQRNFPQIVNMICAE
jgi:hypothetical protein